jgi:uncharacterized membrane protein
MVQQTALSRAFLPSRPASSPRAKGERLAAVDIVRGLAMIFMLINHATWGLPEVSFNASYGWNFPSPVLAASGQHPEAWIGLLQGTPLFFLLAGFGIAFFEVSRRRRGWTQWQITRFFLIRGGLLLAFDFLILPWKFRPVFEWRPSAYFVLFAVGCCLFAVAFLRLLRPRWLLLMALVLTLGTQWIYYTSPIPQDSNLLRSIFLYPSWVDPLAFGFPLLPWLAVILFGYTSGRYISDNPTRILPYSLVVGLSSAALWTVVVVFNDFGVLYHDHPLIFSKHPPALDYLLFYLAMAGLLLAVFSLRPLQARLLMRFLALLGQGALVFYLLHFYVLDWLTLWLIGLPIRQLVLNFVIAGVALLVLFALCSAYRTLRKRYPNSVLQYL